MNIRKIITILCALPLLALGLPAAAQTDLTCDDITFGYEMTSRFPRVGDACLDVVEVDGVMVAVFSALGLLPSLVIPSMAVRMQNPFPLVLIGYSSFVIAFAGLLLAPMKAPLLWACLLGVGPSTFPLALTLINLRTRTPTGSAALSGFMQGVGYSFSCLGPFLVGWLHTVSNGWTIPFSFLFGCALVRDY